MLFNFLEADEKKRLEEWWVHREDRDSYKETLADFLSEYSDLDVQWRYLTDQKTVDISLDIRRLSMAALFLIRASDRLWRESSPLKPKITFETVQDEGNGEAAGRPNIISTVEKGKVLSVDIPNCFDPNSFVEVVIASDREEETLTVRYRRSLVAEYFGLKRGDEVFVAGYRKESEPRFLYFDKYIDGSPAKGKYSVQHGTFRGIVYDLRQSIPVFGRSSKVHLNLYIETYFCLVDCLFITSDERKLLNNLNLGDKILVSGMVTLLDGKPITLVDPSSVEETSYISVLFDKSTNTLDGRTNDT